jgi:signal transduction histidine kinase
MQSMRDRVTALGGIFRIRASARGTRLHILLRGPMVEVRAAQPLAEV